MQIIYISAMVLALLFFLYRRKVDLFALSFAGIFAASPPYLFGYIFIPPLVAMPESLIIEVYLVMLLILSSLVCFALVFDRHHKKDSLTHFSKTRQESFGPFALVLFFFSAALLALSISFIGIDAISSIRHGAKLTPLESGAISKTILFATYSALFSVISKRYILAAASLLILLILFIISPSRSFLFIVISSIMMLYLIPNSKITLMLSLRVFLVAIFIASFLVIAKVIRHEGLTLLGYFNTVFGGGSDIFREANYVAANLQQAFKELTPGELMERHFYYPLMVIPFLYLFLVQILGLSPITRFSEILADIHSFHDWGIGSSLWGEFYGAGGWLSIIFFVVLFNLFLYWVNKMFYQGAVSAVSVAFLVPSVYIAAYSDRLDFMIIMNRFSDAILILIIFVIYSAITNNFKIRKSKLIV